MAVLTTVISGGQTGVDLAALDAARVTGLACCGWCPPGGTNEAGAIPPRYGLRETPIERSPDAPGVPRSLRTAWNVRDADATLVLVPGGGPGGLAGACLDPGTAWTLECARRSGRPWACFDPHAPDAADAIAAWLRERDVAVLNVAGPSEGQCPGVGACARSVLGAAFDRLRATGSASDD